MAKFTVTLVGIGPTEVDADEVGVLDSGALAVRRDGINAKFYSPTAWYSVAPLKESDDDD